MARRAEGSLAMYRFFYNQRSNSWPCGAAGPIIDPTLGLGGHSWEIARRLGAPGRLIGFDKDPAALERARERLM